MLFKYKECMNSFDVFDTLIARRFYDSKSIWFQIGKEYGIDNFENFRPIPDDGSRTFEEIYNELVDKGYISENIKTKIMQREIELEISNSYGIKENIDKVADGDLLITDMYLPGYVIMQIVRSAGMKKQVSIYQSNRDKGSGKIWNILHKNPPYIHIGDNEHSDYNKAKEYGIKSQLYTGSSYNGNEKLLIQNKLNGIANLVREIRLSNNILLHNDYFTLSCQYNLPLIFIILEQLHRKISNPITFLGRDCQSLFKICNSYYTTGYYLPFSRKVAYTNPKLASLYLSANTTPNHMLVDISSTGETWKLLSQYGSHPLTTVIYSDSENRPYLPKTFEYITKNSECGSTNLMLEVMNCADHGMLKNITLLEDRLFFTEYADHELPSDIIDIIHKPIHDAVKLKSFYHKFIRAELSNKTDDFLKDIFKYLVQNICSNFTLASSIPNFLERENEYHQEIINQRENKWKS